MERLCYNCCVDVNRTKGAVYNLNYHLVWCPKYRRSILTGQVASRLRELLDGIAGQYGFEILACEIMPDHVYLFVSAPPKYSPAGLAKLFKGITSVCTRSWVSKFSVRFGKPAGSGRPLITLARRVTSAAR